MTKEQIQQAIDTITELRDENYNILLPNGFVIPADGFAVFTEALRLLQFELKQIKK